MSTRAFIAYDFALLDGTTFGNVLEEARHSQPDTLEIHFPGASGDPKDQGTIWRSFVREEIDKADKFLAFIDLPNANVGFEIGYAFGREKPVAVYRFRSSEHPWLKQPPLRGHFRHQVTTPQGIHEAFLEKGRPITLKESSHGGDGVTVLCPAGTGGPFLTQIEPSWGWRQPPLSEWDVETLPKQFAGTGLVVWIILPHNENENERDGIENTALSILAGYAESRPEIDLRVLIHAGARPVADVEHIAKRFTSNAELKAYLAKIADEWLTKLAARKRPAATSTVASSSSAALAPLRPATIPPHPDDPFPDTADSFIGRETQLGLGEDSVEGLMERFRSGKVLPGSRTIRLIWAHGYGGMGKSWFLHRIRCRAEAEYREIRSLIVDWDKPDWLAPLTGEPALAEDVFDLLAIRLSQRLKVEDADPYWLAKARVAAAASAHKQAIERFENQLQVAGGEGVDRVESHLLQLLNAERIWHDTPDKRRRNLQALREDRVRYREVFGAWCRETGETNSAILFPNRERAEGLRDAFRAAMVKYPLIIVLDTCEVLSDDLDAWLRELFSPLLRESLPLLVLMGSRLRPDLHQPRGSRRGWQPELQAGAVRVEDFGESLRFSVAEIETALSRLRRATTGDSDQLAELLHRITLGIPLAVRGLLDLHEGGDPVLEDLIVPDEDEIPLSEKNAVRVVISSVADRFLLNLENHPERDDDLRDIIALAVLPRIDYETLKVHWNHRSPKDRLRSLAKRYSLLSDGDLHPSVRTYLRRHWRTEDNRPAPFNEVVQSLFDAHAILSDPPPAVATQRIALRAAHLNLRSWGEGDALVDEIARALCLARAFESESQLLEMLLGELPLAGSGLVTARKLWHGDDDDRPQDAQINEWLRTLCASSSAWTDEEKAALDLLEGISSAGRFIQPEDAKTGIVKLENAVAHFGVTALPRSAAVGEAFFDFGYALDPYSPHTPERIGWSALSVAAYERAIDLDYLVSSALNNAANIYPELGQPQKAEQAYFKAIALDPTDAFPHSGLGNLYQYHLGQPKKAEQAYLKAVALDPTEAYSYIGLGNLYQSYLGEPEKAEQAYLKAIELDPKSRNAHTSLGNLYQYQLGQPQKAEHIYLKAIELDSKSADPHTGLGNLYQYYLGQPEKAEHAYLKAVELDPKSAAPYTGFGSLFEQAGRWNEAVDAFRRDQALDQKSGSGQRGQAWVALLSRGDAGEARRWADEAMLVDPEHPGTSLVDIAVRIWAGEWETTRTHFARWVRELPKVSGYLPWVSRNRLAALIQRIRALNGLGQVAEPLRSVSGRPYWHPWSLAVDAVLAGKNESSLTDPKAAEIYSLLNKSARG
jgi:tetratricopeptide (TPR) repeat protein